MTATAFATLEDIEARYPAELITLAADENTGVRDDQRVTRAIEDAAVEILAILRARYGNEELGRLDADSSATLKLYSIDIALYRIALAFSRSNERIKERYDTAIKRLEAIASGKGGLSFTGGSSGDGNAVEPAPSPNEVIIDAPERMFTRNTMRGM